LKKPPIAIFLHGDGKMGRAIASVASQTSDARIEGVLQLRENPESSVEPESDAPPVLRTPPKQSSPGEVVIDFSHASALQPLLRALQGTRLPLVCGTTGMGAAERELLEEYSKETALFYDENMSYGISVIRHLLQAANTMFQDGADVEIVEFHHRDKVDFPSGTAESLARAVRPDAEAVSGRGGLVGPDRGRVHVHSARIGGIPGEHQVHFATPDEIVSLSHRALSRDVFARGAIGAARFLVGRDKGFFTMSDIVKARMEERTDA